MSTDTIRSSHEDASSSHANGDVSSCDVNGHDSVHHTKTHHHRTPMEMCHRVMSTDTIPFITRRRIIIHANGDVSSSSMSTDTIPFITRRRIIIARQWRCVIVRCQRTRFLITRRRHHLHWQWMMMHLPMRNRVRLTS